MIRKSVDRICKILHGLSNTIVWGLSIILMILVVVQASFWVGALWLKTYNGQKWLGDVVENSMEGSGYLVTFDRTSYAFPQGIEVTNLNISDKQGVIADIDRLVIRPHILGVMYHQMGLSADVDTLNVYRYPENAEQNPEPDDRSDIEPLSLPDLYFTRFALSDIEIETLHVHPEVFGLDLVLSPRLSARVAIDKTIEFQAQLSLDDTQTLPVWMPYEVTMDGMFDHQSLILTLDDMIVSNDIAEIQAAGSSSLKDSMVDLNIEMQVDDLTNASPDIAGKFNMQATIEGNINTPSLYGTGVLSMPMLVEHGLDDVHLTVENSNILQGGLGSLALASSYQNQPVSISSDLILNEGILQFDNVKGAATATTFTGDMAFNTDSMIVMGTGVVDVTDLKQYQPITGLDIAGHGRTEFEMFNDNGTQAATINATMNDAVYEDMNLDRATLSATIPNVMEYWPTHMALHAQGFVVSDTANINTLNANLRQLNISDHGDDYALTMDMNGMAQQEFTLKGSADINGIRALSPSAHNIDLTVSTNGSYIVAEGAVDQNQIDMELRANDFSLRSLPIRLPVQLENITTDMKASLKGAMAHPQITASATVSPLLVEDGTSIRLSVNGSYGDNLMKMTMSGRGDMINDLSGNIQIPLKLALNPFVFDLPMDAVLRGGASVDANINDLSSIILPVGVTLAGDMQAHADINGTIESQDIRGRVRLKDGAFGIDAYGIDFHDLNLQANISQDILRIQNLDATDGREGVLSGQGDIGIADSGKTDLALSLSDFALLDRDTIDSRLSADIEFTHDDDQALLSGTMNLDEVNIRIPDRFLSDIPTLNIVNSDENPAEHSLKKIALGIKVQANNRIFVRGWGLDSEFGGAIDIDGTLDNPQLNGVFKSVRGRYDEFGRRFDLAQAYLRFQGSMPPSPYLDIIATTNVDDIEASVNLTGSIENPEIAVTSTPSLPQDEVMSKILFGKNIENISPLQAVQLKQTLDRFAGRGSNGLNPLGAIRNATGLDDIRVDSNDEGETEIGVGKYLSDDVYLELEKGAGAESGTAKIQVEVTPNINVESEIGQDAQAGAGVFWKWDY